MQVRHTPLIFDKNVVREFVAVEAWNLGDWLTLLVAQHRIQPRIDA